MFISHKSNTVISHAQVEWECRQKSKGLSLDEYWTWLNSVTDADGVVDYSGETGYTIIECTDEDVDARLTQLGDYIAEGVYNIKWSDSKVSAVTGQDMGDNDITIETHFTGDDVTRDARLLAEMWVRVRNKRNQLLAETDWIVTQAVEKGESVSDSWKTYRESLRNVPDINNNVVFDQNIVWPEKPEK